MATELDKFVISLAFDIKKLQESSVKASDTVSKMINGIEKSFKTLLSTFALGFSLNMAKNLVENFAKVGSGLEFASESLRLNVTQLNAWQEMAKRVGGSAEGMSSAFASIQSAIVGADFTGGNPVVMALQQMGIATKDSKGNMRDLVSVFNDINTAFQKFTPDQQLKMSKVLGIDPATQRLLSLSTSKFKEQMAEVQHAGLITKEQAEEATRAKVKWDNLNQTWDRIKFNLGEKLYPIFVKVADWALNFAQKTLPSLIREFNSFTESLGLSNDGVLKIVAGFMAFTAIATSIGVVTSAVGLLGAGLAGVMTYLAPVVAELGALAPVVAGLGALGVGWKIGESIHNISNNITPHDPTGILSDSAKARLGDKTALQTELNKYGISYKREKGSLTDIAKGEWQKLIDFYAPQQPQKNNETTPSFSFKPEKGSITDIVKSEWQKLLDFFAPAQSQKESGGNPNAVGDKGKSFGLFQVQKGTAKDILGYEPTSQQLKDPDFNKMLRDKYMAQGMKLSDGNMLGALAFYNGGYNGLDYWKKTGRTLNNYGEDIVKNSINSANLNPRASSINKTSNVQISMGGVAMHGVQNPQGLYKHLSDYMPIVHDSGRLA